MIDAPRRAEPRFPPEAEPWVAAAIAAALDVGGDDVVITQGLAGSDLLVAEHALRRGARVQPAAREGARRLQGRVRRGRWGGARFDAVAAAGGAGRRPAGSARGRDPPDAAANAWVLDEAVRLAGAVSPEAFVAWDREEGDGAGGTAHFARLAREAGLALTAVVPREALAQTPTGRTGSVSGLRVRSARRRWTVAVLRGLITLEVLSRIEHELGGGSETFVLSDHFDYIAVDEHGRDHRRPRSRSGGRVDMSRRCTCRCRAGCSGGGFFPARARRFYKEHGLSEQLRDYFGARDDAGRRQQPAPLRR